MSTELTPLQAAVAHFVTLDRSTPVVGPPEPRRFNEIVAGIHGLATALVEAESTGTDRERIRHAVAPARQIHRRSPFVQRLQDWPRGYPGDFESIEYLCDGRNKATDETSFYIEWYALSCAIAQQHRNKVLAQAAVIERTLNRPGTKVLVLACGSCPDVAMALSRITTSIATDTPRLYLNDADPAALAFARARLGANAPHCTVVPGHAVNVLRRLSMPFDLIVAGGLFDYLSERHCRVLTRLATRLLAPGGQFFFTNIASGNPYRPWLEYCGDWCLIERDAKALEALAHDASEHSQAVTLSLDHDPTGLALLATMTRQDPHANA